MEKQSEGELKRTGEHAAEVKKVAKEREAATKETSTAAGVENDKALADIESAKTCAIQSIEEAYKFKKSKINARKALLQKQIQAKRGEIANWNFKKNAKQNEAEESCKAASRKNATDRVRLEAECKSQTAELEELTTQITVQETDVNNFEKTGLEEIRKEEAKLESKRTKDTIAVEQKADEDRNAI
jgi:hypothetical protein